MSVLPTLYLRITGVGQQKSSFRLENNARLHTRWKTLNKLPNLKEIELIPHPEFSSDLLLLIYYFVLIHSQLLAFATLQQSSKTGSFSEGVFLLERRIIGSKNWQKPGFWRPNMFASVLPVWLHLLLLVE